MPRAKGCKRVSFPLLPFNCTTAVRQRCRFLTFELSQFGGESIPPWVECQARDGMVRDGMGGDDPLPLGEGAAKPRVRVQDLPILRPSPDALSRVDLSQRERED